MLAGADGFGAGFTTDRNKTPIMQFVVGQIITADVIPYILRAPVGQGIELGQHRAGAGETGIALNNGDAGTGARALIFPLTADPGIERVQFSLERFDFANAATFLMAVAIKAEQSLGADQSSDRFTIW